MDNRHLIFFTGIKHSGKTTFASLVAETLGWKHEDSDKLIEEKLEGTSIRDFYKEHGKDLFMELERECVEAFLERESSPFILSLGGGVSDNTKLLDLMKEKGTIVYLRREEKDMLPIILSHGVPAFLDANNIEQSFHKLYEKRDGIYNEWADLSIDLGPYRDKEITKEYIIKILKENGYGL